MSYVIHCILCVFCASLNCKDKRYEVFKLNQQHIDILEFGNNLTQNSQSQRFHCSKTWIKWYIENKKMGITYCLCPDLLLFTCLYCFQIDWLLFLLFPVNYSPSEKIASRTRFLKYSFFYLHAILIQCETIIA